jgi:hypothetical protein
MIPRVFIIDPAGVGRVRLFSRDGVPTVILRAGAIVGTGWRRTLLCGGNSSGHTLMRNCSA